jgi:hypothetical protein
VADRRPADELLVHALASGQTDVQAAASAGVSARTVRRRRRERAFMKQVRKARAELVSGAAGKLAGSMTAASDTLASLLTDDDPAIRLKAADKILAHALRAAELVDLEARVSELEGDGTEEADYEP